MKSRKKEIALLTGEDIIKEFVWLSKTYDGVAKQHAAATNRLKAMKGDVEIDNTGILDRLKSIGGNINTQLNHYLRHYPIYNEWLVKVPGIGVGFSSKLILWYYYKFTPVCPDCETELIKKSIDDKKNTFYCISCDKSVKGGGLLTHKIEYRDFPTISKWWKYLGMHCDETGVKPKLKSGMKADWSSQKRSTCYLIGCEFNKSGRESLYHDFLLGQKVKHLKKNKTREKEWTAGHILNAARNEAAKLFLAHFWVVARTIDEKPVSEPYVGTIMGHTNIIRPFYWENEIYEKVVNQ